MRSLRRVESAVTFSAKVRALAATRDAILHEINVQVQIRNHGKQRKELSVGTELFFPLLLHALALARLRHARATCAFMRGACPAHLAKSEVGFLISTIEAAVDCALCDARTQSTPGTGTKRGSAVKLEVNIAGSELDSDDDGECNESGMARAPQAPGTDVGAVADTQNNDRVVVDHCANTNGDEAENEDADVDRDGDQDEDGDQEEDNGGEQEDDEDEDEDDDDDEDELVLDSVEIASPATNDAHARQVKKRLSGQGMQLLNEALASGEQMHK